MTNSEQNPPPQDRRRPPEAFLLKDGENPADSEPKFVSLLTNEEAKIVKSDDFVKDDFTHGANLDLVSRKIKKKFTWGLYLLVGLTGTIILALGLQFYLYISELFSQSTVFGYVGIGFMSLVVLGLLGLIVREWLGLRSLRRIDHLRRDLQAAMERDDQTATKRIVAKLITLYGDRPQLADGRQVMSNYLKEIMDAGELVAHLENELLKPLDHEARQLIMQSAVRVSILTTASPRVITEFLIILAENLRLIRKVMVVYGGRPGIGSNYRLIRHVLTNLAAAVGMEAGSEIVTDILGQGILTKISARVGEGMINGMLTIRVGFATLEYCRPCPYSGDKTSAIGQLYTALKNTFSSKNKNSEPKSGDNTQKNE